MATDIERLTLQLSADIRSMQKAFEQGAASANKAASAIENRFEAMQKRLQKTQQNFARDFTNVIAAAGVGLVARDVSHLADAYIEASNKLAFAGVAAEDLTKTQADLAQLAKDTRSEYEAIVSLYARLSRASTSLGNVTEKDIRRVTQTVAKALAGATQGERASAILQLGQGLSSGALAGEELKAIRENSRVAAEAIAKEFGVTVGQLKQLGAEGKLVSERVFAGLLKASADVDAAFERTRTTVGNAFQSLRTSVIQYIGEADKAGGASLAFAAAVNGVANNIEDIALAMQVVGAAALGVFGTRLAQATLAALATGAATRGLAAALATLGGPVGLAVAALAAGMVYLADKNSAANRQLEIQQKVTRELAPITVQLEEATRLLATAQGKLVPEIQKATAEHVKSALAKLRDAEATAVLLEAEAKRREDGLAAAMETRPLDPELPFIGEMGASAAATTRAVRARAEVAEIRRQIAEQLDKIVAADNERQRIGASTSATTNAAAAKARMENERVLFSAMVKLQLEALEKAQAAEAALRNTKKVAQELKAPLQEDARNFLSRLPGNTRVAREELAQLRDLIKAGIFNGLGEQNGAALAQVEVLRDLAYAAGETTEALIELQAVNDLTPEQARQAAEQIRRAAREGRAARDEELGRIFRTSEIRDDVKSALYEAMKTGQYADVFRERIADALDRAAERSLDKFVDIIFDGIASIGKQSSKGDKSSNGGGSGWASFIASFLGGLFGGGRATGGSVQAGKGYMVGERGPEPFFPTQNGFIMSNAMMRSMQAPVTRQTTIVQRSEVKFSQTLNLEGANGDMTIRSIARDETAKGVRMALQIADKNAPARQRRHQMLGS
jgi:tape measure domain-containing protein